MQPEEEAVTGVRVVMGAAKELGVAKVVVEMAESRAARAAAELKALEEAAEQHRR